LERSVASYPPPLPILGLDMDPIFMFDFHRYRTDQKEILLFQTRISLVFCPSPFFFYHVPHPLLVVFLFHVVYVEFLFAPSPYAGYRLDDSLCAGFLFAPPAYVF
jgi:hypothetical protein